MKQKISVSTPYYTFIPGQTPEFLIKQFVSSNFPWLRDKTEAPGVLASLPRCRRNPDEKKRRVQKDEKEVGKRQPNRSAKMTMGVVKNEVW